MNNFEQIFEEARDLQAVLMLDTLIGAMRRADFTDPYIAAVLMSGVRTLVSDMPDKLPWARYFAAFADELREAT